ncbi:MAG: hypothetical protein WCX17_04730 [Parcubacteria group bacterium]|jgi:chromosome segregation ATPase
MKKAIGIIFSAALLFSCSLALAEDGQSPAEQHREEVKNRIETRKTTLAEIKSEWKEKRAEFLNKLKAEKEELKNKFKEKFTEEKCERVQARIENRNGFFKGTYEKHTAVYVNLVDRINKFITKAEEQKINTDTIKAHLAELQTKIDKFKDDYAAYSAKLGETKNYTCGHSEGEFRGVLLESKTLLKQVHADAADIRKYVRETILVDLKALKAQMPKSEEND